MRARRVRSRAVAVLLTAAVAVSVALAPRAAHAGDAPADAQRQLDALLDALDRSDDPGTRVELAQRLARETAVRAAERLRDLVRDDTSVTVRMAAARALGRSPAPCATKLLLELTLRGGPRGVRRALGLALAERAALPELLEALAEGDGQDDRDDLGRGLLVEALGRDVSPEAAETLGRIARGPDAHLRREALRALAAHELGRAQLPALLREVLGRWHDLDTVMATLDLAEGFADEQFRAFADVLDTFLEPEVQGAVDAARRRLAWLDAVAAARAASKGGYASDLELPDPPPPRPRIDIVYVFDATGSVSGHVDVIKQRIVREARTLARTGSDFRLGLVAYRDTPRRRGSWTTQVLPLSYDLAGAERWIDAVPVGGCDSEGASITQGLEEALCRMGWREGVERQVALIADSRTGNADACRALVKLHWQADHTRLHVWYLHRTRPHVPPDVEALARVGGGTVESLE